MYAKQVRRDLQNIRFYKYSLVNYFVSNNATSKQQILVDVKNHDFFIEAVHRQAS